MKLIAQGAESKLYVKGDLLVKKRVKKSYRIKQLDLKLRRLRTRAETRMMKRAIKIINVPRIHEVSEFEIKMDYINGPVLRDVLRENLKELSQLGVMIAKLHEHDYIHGDLTTSNMILKDGELFLIDFGLSEVNKSIEAKAVDLHVLKQALEAKHHQDYKQAWKVIKEAYLKDYKQGKEVLKRLKKVEARGRYKKKHT